MIEYSKYVKWQVNGMANVIAVIWDFDKTLVDGYMQDPIFRHYDVNSTEFWKEVQALPEKYMREQGVKTNKDTIYLNHFINCAQPGGIFDGLNNKRLREYGKELKFYKGIPEIFDKTKNIIESNRVYKEYGITLEHYIVSTGFAETIKGSDVAKYVKYIWGCELIEKEVDGKNIIGEIGYTIDNTSKTRAIFEINKGIPDNPQIDVNAKMDKEIRRVQFENMIYIADGPSDVPAFSLVNSSGGYTFAIYPQNNNEAFRQVEKLRSDGRIDMYAQADYSEGTTAYMWITNAIENCAEKICKKERAKIEESTSGTPKHLI